MRLELTCYLAVVMPAIIASLIASVLINWVSRLGYKATREQNVDYLWYEYAKWSPRN